MNLGDLYTPTQLFDPTASGLSTLSDRIKQSSQDMFTQSQSNMGILKNQSTWNQFRNNENQGVMPQSPLTVALGAIQGNLPGAPDNTGTAKGPSATGTPTPGQNGAAPDAKATTTGDPIGDAVDKALAFAGITNVSKQRRDNLVEKIRASGSSNPIDIANILHANLALDTKSHTSMENEVRKYKFANNFLTSTAPAQTPAQPGSEVSPPAGSNAPVPKTAMELAQASDEQHRFEPGYQLKVYNGNIVDPELKQKQYEEQQRAAAFAKYQPIQGSTPTDPQQAAPQQAAPQAPANAQQAVVALKAAATKNPALMQNPDFVAQLQHYMQQGLGLEAAFAPDAYIKDKSAMMSGTSMDPTVLKYAMMKQVSGLLPQATKLSEDVNNSEYALRKAQLGNDQKAISAAQNTYDAAVKAYAPVKAQFTLAGAQEMLPNLVSGTEGANRNVEQANTRYQQKVTGTNLDMALNSWKVNNADKTAEIESKNNGIATAVKNLGQGTVNARLSNLANAYQSMGMSLDQFEKDVGVNLKGFGGSLSGVIAAIKGGKSADLFAGIAPETVESMEKNLSPQLMQQLATNNKNLQVRGSTPGGSAPKPETIPKVSTHSAWTALPAGSKYVFTDGHTYIKSSTGKSQDDKLVK